MDALSAVVWFFGRFPLKKLGRYFIFFSSSNKNSGKAFVVLSKKMLKCD
jgi:hypothetical protein